jgi:hypothetical protein
VADQWQLDDLELIPVQDRKEYAREMRRVSLGLVPLARDGSGLQLVGVIGKKFKMAGHIVHLDLDDMAARVVARDVTSFLVKARRLTGVKKFWHWLNEMTIEDFQNAQPGYAIIEAAVGLARKPYLTAALLLSMRKSFDRTFVQKCLRSPCVEISQRAIEEMLRRKIRGMNALIESSIEDSRMNMSVTARWFLREIGTEGQI